MIPSGRTEVVLRNRYLLIKLSLNPSNSCNCRGERRARLLGKISRDSQARLILCQLRFPFGSHHRVGSFKNFRNSGFECSFFTPAKKASEIRATMSQYTPGNKADHHGITVMWDKTLDGLGKSQSSHTRALGTCSSPKSGRSTRLILLRWAKFLAQLPIPMLTELAKIQHKYKTDVVDSADWLEQLI